MIEKYSITQQRERIKALEVLEKAKKLNKPVKKIPATDSEFIRLKIKSTKEDRKAIVLKLHSEGLTNKEICDKTKYSRQTVYNYLK